MDFCGCSLDTPSEIIIFFQANKWEDQEHLQNNQPSLSKGTVPKISFNGKEYDMDQKFIKNFATTSEDIQKWNIFDHEEKKFHSGFLQEPHGIEFNIWK